MRTATRIGAFLSFAFLSLAVSREARADDALIAKPPEANAPMPIAADEPPPRPTRPWVDDWRASHMFSGGLTLSSFASQTTAASTDFGGLAGFRIDALGVDRSFAYRTNLEARLGASADGFVSRDRGALAFGGAIPIQGFGAMTIRGGADTRYVRTGIVEFGRLYVPHLELGMYRFAGEGGVKIDIAGTGGLVPYASLRGPGTELDRTLAPGAGGMLSIGKKNVVGRVSYVHVAGRNWMSDVDASLCFGEGLYACLEADHTIADPDSGRVTSWRGLVTIGIGAAEAKR